MAAIILERVDAKRGCGWRKPGALYMVGSLSEHCGRLPIKLEKCPCCGGGYKPALGWTWIDADEVLATAAACFWAAKEPPLIALIGDKCLCPFSGSTRLGRSGLLWIGSGYYRTPGHFINEANTDKGNGELYGISRRINAVPRGFIVGETRIFLAHRQGDYKEAGTGSLWKGAPPVSVPAIFASFVPTAIEYLCRGDEAPEEIAALVKRGITPISVERLGQEELIV